MSSNEFFADVKITKAEHGVTSVLVNGEEMNRHILADSLTVTFPSDEMDYGTALVQMTLCANVDIDYPDAKIAAEFKAEGDEA